MHTRAAPLLSSYPLGIRSVNERLTEEAGIQVPSCERAISRPSGEGEGERGEGGKEGRGREKGRQGTIPFLRRRLIGLRRLIKDAIPSRC